MNFSSHSDFIETTLMVLNRQIEVKRSKPRLKMNLPFLSMLTTVTGIMNSYQYEGKMIKARDSTCADNSSEKVTSFKKPILLTNASTQTDTPSISSELVRYVPPLPPSDSQLAAEVSQTNIYIDLSNLMIGFKTNYKTNLLFQHWRLDFIKLHYLLVASNQPNRTVAIGSFPVDKPKISQIYDRFRRLKYDVQVIKRINKEDYVDDILIDEIHSLTGLRDPFHKEKLVIVTGDGNFNHGRDTFPSTVIEALTKGWLVEIWAWENACSKFYKLLDSRAKHYDETNRYLLEKIRRHGFKHGHEHLITNFELHFLDDHLEQITFKEQTTLKPNTD
jgi:hypothetical protein